MSSLVDRAPTFGDFQTPAELAAQVWASIPTSDVRSVIEPTVGLGSFLATSPDEIRAARWVCFDIHDEYVKASRRAAKMAGLTDASVTEADAFHLDATDFSSLDPSLPVLAIGNPPWVTSAAQSNGGPRNLPSKSNARFGLRGLDAITGHANFDIAEAILLRLIDALSPFADARLAFLVKRSVAMKLARRLLGTAQELAFSRIDAMKHFGAAADAGLFYARIVRTGAPTDCVLIADGLGECPRTRAGMHDNGFVEDLDAHSGLMHLEAPEPVAWRQGIKHDLAKVLELRAEGSGLKNGFGEAVNVEPEALSPLYKSSDLANGRPATRRFPLYQVDLSGPLPELGTRWSKLRSYLETHADSFSKRRSRIYQGKYEFMLFGVGPYVLAPWKVAVSGMYRTSRFVAIGPDKSGRPAVVDDTCYLLPFATRDDAETVAEYLNSEPSQRLLGTLADVTAKRPFTRAVLSRVAVPRPPIA